MLEEVVTVDQVQHVGECVVHGLGHQSELAQESVLRHCVRLGDDKVVTVGEQVEGILQEVD